MNAAEHIKQRDERIKQSMAKIRFKIAVMSGKGGVGKTTVAVNLARALAEKHAVGLLDTDITGPNAPKMLGLQEHSCNGGKSMVCESREGIKTSSTAFLLPGKDTPVIWRGPMRSNLIAKFLESPGWGGLDYLVIDLPPGTGDEALSVAQTIPGLGGAVVVTTPQQVSVMDCCRAINFCRELGTRVLGIVENMSYFNCPHCSEKTHIFGENGGFKAAESMQVPFLGEIPINPGLCAACDEGARPSMQEKAVFGKLADKIISAIQSGKSVSTG